MAIVIYPVLFIVGVLPAIIWLLFYLRKDVHPEPNSMVIKIFFWGILATLPAFFTGLGVADFLFSFVEKTDFTNFLYFFFGVAFVEEFLKYLVVRSKVQKSAELDEPTDVILYLIIAALGFAALENVLYLLNLKISKDFFLIYFFLVYFLRFFGAIFLHALCSGALGYFLALSFYQPEKKIKLLGIGFFLAIFSHALFNFGIIKMEENLLFAVVPMVIIIGLAVFVSWGFKKLQKKKGICKIR